MTRTGVLPWMWAGNLTECASIFGHGLLSFADPLTID